MSHFREVCEDHGTLYTQCRCPSKDKLTRKVKCKGTCPKPEEYKQDKDFILTIQCTIKMKDHDIKSARMRAEGYDGLASFARTAGRDWTITNIVQDICEGE